MEISNGSEDHRAITDALVLKNKYVEVSYDQSTGEFTATDLASNKLFLKEGSFTDGAGEAAIISLTDPDFGAGEAIKIVYSNSNTDYIFLYPDIPFLFFKSIKSNRTSSYITLNEIKTVSASVDLGLEAGSLKAFGTGGLHDPGKNPGSYAFLATVDPSSRRGVVGAWLTHERGSGLVFTDVSDGKVRINPRLEYGRLRIAVNADAELETFILGYFEDARIGLEQFADMSANIADVNLPPQPVGYCTWYADKYGRSSDEVHLPQLVDYASGNLASHGFDFIQIDDKWQEGITDNGPAKNFLTHKPDGPYPSGMEAMAGKITGKGFTAGLWIMPFVGNYKDPFFADHQDWFVKNPDGTPFENKWSGNVLDMTHSGPKQHLYNIVKQATDKWGYKYLKLDGYYAGFAGKHLYTNSSYKEEDFGNAIYHDPYKTNIEAFRDGAKLVRETAGEDVFLLGCTMAMNMRVMGPSFGMVDAMRVGPDNGAAWRSLPRGPRFGSRFYFLHGRVWYNDPDPVYVRNSMPLKHARYISSWVGFSGQLYVNSDWLPIIDADRLELLKKTMAPHGLKPRPSDYFERDLPRIWLLTDTSKSIRRDVIGLFNHDDEDIIITELLQKTGLSANSYEAFDFWNDQLLEPIANSLNIEVPAQDARIIAVRPVADYPQLISTSHHISQGIIDVEEESWNKQKMTLTGTSHLIGNDLYELRIVSRENAIKEVAVSKEDKAAGVTVTYNQTGPLVRISINSPESRKVSWSAQFKN